MHDYGYAAVQREEDDRGVDLGIRSSAGNVRRASPAPIGGAADIRATSREVGKFSLDGSGDRVAVDGRMRW